MFNTTELTQLCRQAGHSEDSIADAMSRFEFVDRPCTQLEIGKYYRWVGGSERPYWFNPLGEMDEILDRKPRKCLMSWCPEVCGQRASFDKTNWTFMCGGWWWRDIAQNFVECVPLSQMKQDTEEADTMPPMVG